MPSNTDEKDNIDTVFLHDESSPLDYVSACEELETDEDEETPEECRKRVHRYFLPREPLSRNNHREHSLRRFSRKLVRQSSSIIETTKPQTPQGWIVLISLVASAILGYEVRLQTALTCPPTVYGQIQDGPLKEIYERLTKEPTSILRRLIHPSLFLGTRSLVSSTAAYLLGGPSPSKDRLRLRQLLRMPQDGAMLALDWELPQSSQSAEAQRSNILHGPIALPVILILHGINNDSSFGYMRSAMRCCTDLGWIAVGMNFRGCGGVPMSTPRSYNGAYTGDLRGVVHSICGRLDPASPLFIVGNSLGANLVTKYLGEEGLFATLPSNVAGGITFGNPMSMDTSNIDMIFSPLMALGVKKSVLMNWSAFRGMKEPGFQAALRKAMLATTLGQFDDALAPMYARNDPYFPFAFRIGYKEGKSYWTDASSYRLSRYVSVPLLQVIAGDDFLVFSPFRNRLSYSISNPNVMVVETKAGGHLGWQEATPNGKGFGPSSSWADAMTTEFIEAILDIRQKKRSYKCPRENFVDHRELDIIPSKL